MHKHTFRFATLPALALLAACAQLPSTVPGADDNASEANAVLATMDRYMTAISTKNYAAQRALDMPNAMTWSARPDRHRVGALRIQDRRQDFALRRGCVRLREGRRGLARGQCDVDGRAERMRQAKAGGWGGDTALGTSRRGAGRITGLRVCQIQQEPAT